MAIDRYKGGYVRSISEQGSNNVLEPLSGSRSGSGGCIQTTVAIHGVIFEPTLETHIKSTEEIERKQSEISSASDTFMENTVLVANGSPSSAGQANRLKRATVRLRYLISHGGYQVLPSRTGSLSEAIMKKLQQKNREASIQAYNEYWRNWVRWCKMQGANLLLKARD
ncbi:hypothetical protein RMATCC62417_10186 [Rhizopus microsporus]|nr:hypothetical protein RMATCC62417_10186 [Rhizopus microsporus]